MGNIVFRSGLTVINLAGGYLKTDENGAISTDQGAIGGGLTKVEIVGVQDGINRTFALALPITSQTYFFYLNGQLLVEAIDYTATGNILSCLFDVKPTDNLAFYM